MDFEELMYFIFMSEQEKQTEQEEDPKEEQSES